MTTRGQIVDEARKWLDVRWRHQGRDRTQGIDCAGLILVVGWKFGLLHGNTTGYRQGVAAYRFMDAFNASGMIEKPLEQLRYGDVIALAEASVYPCHVALCGRGTIIHAHIRYRKVVEEPYTDEWVGKTIACFSFPGFV